MASSNEKWASKSGFRRATIDKEKITGQKATDKGMKYVLFTLGMNLTQETYGTL